MNYPVKGKKSIHADFLLLDLLSLLVSFVLSYLIKFGDFSFVNSDTWMPLLYVVSLLDIVICLFSDPYSGIFRRPYYDEIIRTFLLAVYNLFSTGVMFYVLKIGVAFSRQMILTMYGLYFIISLILKCVWKKLVISRKIRIHNPKKTSVFVVGNASGVSDVIRNTAAGDFETYEVRGIFLTDDESTAEIDGVPVIHGDYVEYIIENGIEEILFAQNRITADPQVCKTLISAGVGVHFYLDGILGFDAEDHAVSNVGVNKTLSVGLYSFTEGQTIYFIIKRFLDIVFSLLGCVLLAPAAAVIKLIYLISGDRAPIIFKQCRIGKSGKKINIYKFRTMVPDAEKMLASLLKDEKIREEWNANQKLSEDPRITAVGKLLRKTSVDELPQLINVLKGEMSLVGPRPLVEGELELHNGMKLYQQVKPGITGWWGCNGRSNIDYKERLELEYYYVKNISFYLDFLCVLRTVLSIIRRDGAE